MVTHGNLLHTEIIRQAFRPSAALGDVGWLPLYRHGLIRQVLHPLYLGASCVFDFPAASCSGRCEWLEAISSLAGQPRAAADFSYELLRAQGRDGRDHPLDRSPQWPSKRRGAWSGAESHSGFSGLLPRRLPSRILLSFAMVWQRHAIRHWRCGGRSPAAVSFDAASWSATGLSKARRRAPRSPAGRLWARLGEPDVSHRQPGTGARKLPRGW